MVYSRKSRRSRQLSIKKKNEKLKKQMKTLPKNELEFFRELGYLFINENRYYILVFIILTPIILILTYYFIHWFIGICFVMGFLEFLFNFWFVRKMFIFTMIRLKLKNDSVELKYHNWMLFQRFLTSVILTLNLATSNLFVFLII